MPVRHKGVAFLLSYLVCGALAGLGSGLDRARPGELRTGTLEGLLFDSALRARAEVGQGLPGNPPGEPVVVVALDRASLASQELRVPMAKDAPPKPVPRPMMGPVWARLIEALRGAGAEVIGFDFLFGYSGSELLPGYDRPLLRALYRNRSHLVLGRSGNDKVPVPSYQAALRGQPNSLGIIELQADRDQVLRRVPDEFASRRGPVPSLANAVIRQSGRPGLQGRVLLTPRRHPESIPSFSIKDVLRCAREEPEALRRVFEGRLVFVGSTLPVEDRKVTSARFLPQVVLDSKAEADCGLTRLGPSVPGSHSIPGVFVHAMAVRAVARGDRVREVPDWVVVVLAVASALLGVFIGLHLRPWVAVIAVSLGAAGLWAMEVAGLLMGWWLAVGSAVIALSASAVVAYLVRYVVAERRRHWLQVCFGHYLSPALVERLADNEGELVLRGENREVTILFSDLSGFTALSERLSPEQLVELTNGYLTEVADAVQAHDGYVDKFIGDAVMAIWGAPVADSRHAEHAVRGALDAAARVARAREQGRRRGEPGFQLKTGIYSGDAVVGNVGSRTRVNYTAVGESVNIASRMEGLAGAYACPVLVGEVTATMIRDRFLLREIDRVVVKGKSRPLAVYQPLADLADADPGLNRIAETYERALALFRRREFRLAADLWWSLRGSDGESGPEMVMARRAEFFLETPPPEDWDGSWTMTNK